MANKVIRGNQMKTFLHVDDLKISHENPKAETKGIDYLKGVYVNMTVHHSKVHENLAIKFYFSTPGEVKVWMIRYVKYMLDDFPEELVATAATP